MPKCLKDHHVNLNYSFLSCGLFINNVVVTLQQDPALETSHNISKFDDLCIYFIEIFHDMS